MVAKKPLNGGHKMNRSTRIRQTHRWLAITFTATVIVTFLALLPREPIVWVSYVPLFPLALLMLTGLYLFFSGWRRSGPR
jgi:hypothetical protein